ncbi:putative peptidoglycan glycosyltransferase FtsW [bacterium HR21]|jgi:cell division protein FtsW|nr:putative peptidoglycan glycosyltransferase FtsW [bacterium HR21]
MRRRLSVSDAPVDWLVLLSTVALLLFSVALVYSAGASIGAEKFGSSHYFLQQQALRAGLSIATIIALMFVDYRFWKRLASGLLWGSIGLLLLTLVLSEPVKGAARWLQLGPVQFQPSEFVKFALPLALAARLLEAEPPLTLSHPALRQALLWIVLCCGLIAAQPNASAAGLVAALSFLVLAACGVRGYTLLVLALFGGSLFTAYVLAAPYRLQRLLGFWKLWQGEMPYQVQQSLIAFGHGGLFGVGPGQSLQREFFLPEAYGDFIFAIIGEEYGLLGTTTVVLVFLLLLWRGLRIAWRSPDPFGSVVALSFSTTLALSALIHMGVATGLLPVTGIPLPFLSYGGSSVLFSAAAIGVLLNIGRHSYRIPLPAPTYVLGTASKP